MSSRVPKILCSLDLNDAPEATRILKKCGSLVCLEPQRDEVISEIRDADVYFASAAVEVDQAFLKDAGALKLVASPSTGTDHLDLVELRKRRITVYDIAKEYELLNQFTATSELAFGLMLSLARRIKPASIDASSGHWAREKYSGFQLRGKTLGILGLGRLGQITAKIASGFQMNVIACDVRDLGVENVRQVSFEELFTISDVVSIHTHLNKDTEGLVGKRAFDLMKPTSLIINTSRGRIIDEEALLNALKNDSIAGAGLDVINGEWLSRKELNAHPLIAYSRVSEKLLIVPHIGGSTFESITLARIFMAKRIADFLGSGNNEGIFCKDG